MGCLYGSISGGSVPVFRHSTTTGRAFLIAADGDVGSTDCPDWDILKSREARCGDPLQAVQLVLLLASLRFDPDHACRADRCRISYFYRFATTMILCGNKR